MVACLPQDGYSELSRSMRVGVRTFGMQDTYPKIIANAERLLEDAKHLYAAKRFRSAVSLAVLAAEEIGKVVILSLPHDLRSKDYVNSLSSHREKLAAFAVMACEQMVEKVESETLKTIGLPNTQEGRRDLRHLLRTMREENPVVSEAFTKALGIEDGGALSDTFVRWFTNTYLELFGSADGLFKVSLPIEVVVLNCWVTLTNVTLCRSNTSTSLAKSVSDRLRRSIL